MKIALVGSEPESHGLAPWDDSSWEIWSCGLTSERFPRVDRHFEVHCLERMEKAFGPERLAQWVAHLNAHPSVFMVHPQPDVPDAVILDIDRLFRRFSPYFFTSTMAWMMGHAILQVEARRAKGVFEEEVIGLWGIDCTAQEEYLLQRPGVHFFIIEAQRAKIEVYAPLESDILIPPPQYGLCEFDNQHRKIWARRDRLRRERAQLELDAARTADKLAELNALTSYLDYELRTWGGTYASKRRSS